jgi:hypothetical protein
VGEAPSHAKGVHAEWKAEKEALDLQKATGNADTGLRYLTRTFADMVGSPLLIPRDWLGYLASGMGLGESVSDAS